MLSGKPESMVGESILKDERPSPSGGYVQLLDETYYRITHVDQMPPFFMSLVSSADHWLFIASTGGLTAGRSNADSALFPYETEDKVTAHNELTGSKTIVRVQRNGRTQLWEPFSSRYAGIYRCERHLYKNIPGNKLVFEEINHDLGLTLRLAWRTSDQFGFVRSCWLSNHSKEACQVELLDGLQNLLPYGATVALQSSMSSLLHAYKRNELEDQTGLGIFALSATLTDQAEPSESLIATTVWQVGLDAACYLLCTKQVDQFRYGRCLTPEHDICGKAGAYFVNTAFELLPDEEKHWHIVADVNQDGTAVTKQIQFLQQDPVTIEQHLEQEIDQSTNALIRYVAAADGLQTSAQQTTSAHHFANVLFNIMRGGIFAHGYQIQRNDLLDFVQIRNKPCYQIHTDWFAALPKTLFIQDLYAKAAESQVPDLIRLCYEYLPLTFSRRHGDPSRPWNQFSINLKQPDGSLQLDYQGNWRDIFQNWEPLAAAYPAFVPGMIAKFLNATTADGYNPYRVTRNGIEWEVPEPDNPWANIGYWSDHQIIYLQKLLEIAEQTQPGLLTALWQQPIFAYANVPYRLRPYQEMLTDWYTTIEFDWTSEKATETAVIQLGTDGRLHHDGQGNVIHVTMTEKLLVLLLAKLTNLVPEGGIWMNTQRPEWNDANNALVGKGLSVVTTAYLRRFIAFWLAQLATVDKAEFTVNTAVATLFQAVQKTFIAYEPRLQTGFTNQARREVMNALGTAATKYRAAIYQDGIPTSQMTLNNEMVQQFLTLAQRYIGHTLQANRRADGLAHTYNILRLEADGAVVENLYLMLEGQVAMLSSGLLTPEEAFKLLQNLPQSDLYRTDQHSYMLYPNRKLPGFRQKNNVSAAQVAHSKLVAALMQAGDGRLLSQDGAGVFHFNGRFRNANDVKHTLADMAQVPELADLVAAEQEDILALFETTFNHSAFTGRSGTFFAYEGLGSIYWHMVSKLLLAAQECYQQAVNAKADAAIIAGLAEAYYGIRAGLSFNKTPAVYGAFPTDPYSHTPWGSGARQPGMTGQVKEEILARWGELGISVQQGKLHFTPSLLQADEFWPENSDFCYVNKSGAFQTIALPPHSIAFTLGQTPIVYTRSDVAQIELVGRNGRTNQIITNCLDHTTTQHILNRTGKVQLVHVSVVV